MVGPIVPNDGSNCPNVGLATHTPKWSNKEKENQKIELDCLIGKHIQQPNATNLTHNKQMEHIR